MSRVTQHVGYGLTYSSTFMHPYYTARLMNSLDHVTGGRIAMNLVTSTRPADAANFGFDELMEHGSPLRPDGGVRRCLPQAVGQRGAGRDVVGPRHRAPSAILGESARRVAPWPLLQGARPA